jgi:hypothetical protein
MLITTNIHTLVPEAALAASVTPCPLKLESGRWFGNTPGLARRCVR